MRPNVGAARDASRGAQVHCGFLGLQIQLSGSVGRELHRIPFGKILAAETRKGEGNVLKGAAADLVLSLPTHLLPGFT